MAQRYFFIGSALIFIVLLAVILLVPIFFPKVNFDIKEFFLKNYLNIIIGILVALFIYITVVVIKKIIKKVDIHNQNRVKEASLRYQDILALNRRFNFNLDLGATYTLKYSVNSKPQFDRFIFEKNIKDTVATESDYFSKKIYEARINDNFFKQYISEYANIHEFEENNIPIKMSKRKYHKIEKTICENETIYPVTKVKFTFVVTYTSPQGRNYYRKDYSVSGDDIVAYKILIDEELDYKKSKEYQRKAMTDSLRYDVMQKDGFRCVLCGRTANDGIKLHVDHIIPVSKGGLTEMSNLRTLCEDCNRGKSDKYDPNDVN